MGPLLPSDLRPAKGACPNFSRQDKTATPQPASSARLLHRPDHIAGLTADLAPAPAAEISAVDTTTPQKSQPLREPQGQHPKQTKGDRQH